eukprot:1157775-Pelagomonas_calceolata.AAC.17
MHVGHSGSAGLGSLPRSGGHLGGFSDEAEGEDGGWVELEGNGGADNNAGVHNFHRKREGGGEREMLWRDRGPLAVYVLIMPILTVEAFWGAEPPDA